MWTNNFEWVKTFDVDLREVAKLLDVNPEVMLTRIRYLLDPSISLSPLLFSCFVFQQMFFNAYFKRVAQLLALRKDFYLF
jgi:hypothetical protein